MNNEVILHVVLSELQELSFVLPDQHEIIGKSITNRLDDKDEASVIRSKIYDALFFYCSGSHIEKQPFKLEDFSLFARRIKVAIDKPEGEIWLLSNQITVINSNLEEFKKKTSSLHHQKTDLVERLQKICPHLEYVQYTEHWTDEYGSDCYGDCIRKCVACTITEKGTRKYCNYPEPSSFTKIIGTQVRIAGIQYTDLKL